MTRTPGSTAERPRAALLRPLPPIVYAATLSLLVSLAAIAPAEAQVTTPRGGRRPTSPLPGRPGAGQPAGRDTTRRAPGDTTAAGRDSTQQRELVKWAEPDSVMQALQGRDGFSVTRYQGRTVLFDARNRVLTLSGDSTRGAPAAVSRDQSLIVGDTVIYNDSTQIVRALGDTVVLRDPAQGSDVVARGSAEYDLATQRARVSNIATEVQSGEEWRVGGVHAAYKATTDGAGAPERAFYVTNGWVTSCDDTIPDYHFEAREIKLVQNRILAARPAVLYIADIPVMVVPFLFQDLRSGRRSGLLTPRFGVNELFRSSGGYRRHFDNLGYYFALNDYTDAQAWIDWRSGSGTTNTLSDPGWIRYNGEWRYRWLDRFLQGRLATSYMRQRDGFRNFTASLGHQQDFSQSSHLTADLNYASNTQLQRQNTFNSYAALATIASRINFQNQLGPFALSLGGDRRQYPGRKQIDQTLPTIGLSSQPISIASWLVWTPSLNATNTENLNIDQSGATTLVIAPGAAGGLDTVKRVLPSRHNRSLSFNTPFRIFGFQLTNALNLNDREDNSVTPRQVETVVRGPDGRPLPSGLGGDSVTTATRLFSGVYQSDADWSTGFSLPALFHGSWNLTPFVNLANVAGGPFWVRSTFSGGQWVHQSKRLQYGVTTSPTFFALLPGFGPVSRFRHAISPVISYNYAPAARVGDEYLEALQISRRGYLGELQANAISLGLSTNVEAKLRGGADTTQLGGGTKLKVLAIDFDQIGFDFARRAELKRRANDPVHFPNAQKPGRWAGITTDRLGARLRSDLLPGFQLSTRYSLFKGDPASDTAVFKPFREEVSANFSLNQESGIFAALSRVLGRAAPPKSPGTPQVESAAPDRNTAFQQQVLSQPVAGSDARDAQFSVPTGRGWQGSFTFSSTRQRPVTGSNVIAVDPAQACSVFQAVDPTRYALCLVNPAQFGVTGGAGTDLNQGAIGANAPVYVSPPLTTLGSQVSFNITPRWAASWGTTYDFRRHDFASQIVTVQRELHDWRAIFAFSQAPNGNFAFNFFISLNAQPELKLNFDRRSYPDNGTTSP